jgi:hypothetical protein
MKPKLFFKESGQALILIALAAIGLFGIAGLAIDGSAKFSDRRHAQNAADTAALAGARALARGEPLWYIDAAQRALENGYDDNHVSNEVEVHNPPTTGIYADCSDVHFDCNDYVEVIIDSNVNTFFARVVGIHQTHNHVEAVASKITENNNFNFGGNAIVALSPEGCALKAAGNTDVTINGGGMYSNSDSGCAFHQQTCAGALDVYNADGSQGSISMVGSDSTGNCPPGANLVDYASKQLPFPPPYEEISEPAVCSNSLTNAPSGTTVTLSPGHYDAMPPRPNIKDVTLEPGIYCINTEMRFGAGDIVRVTGTFGADPGVFFYFKPGGSFTVNGGAIVNLWGINANNDPALSAYTGFLMYVVPDYATGTPPTCKLNGGSTSGYEGMIYAPYCNLIINGNSGMVVESQLVGYTVDLSGASGVILNYESNSSPVWNIPLQVGLTK